MPKGKAELRGYAEGQQLQTVARRMVAITRHELFLEKMNICEKGPS